MFRWFFLLIPFLLMAYEAEESEEAAKVVSDLSDFNSDPSAMVHSVNVITGQFVDWNVDMTVMGPVPLTWERSCGHERKSYYWEDNWWRHATHKKIKKIGESDQSSTEIEGAHGREFAFVEKYKKKAAPHIVKMHPDRFEYGVTNTPGKKSGMRHQRNVVLEDNRPYFTLKEGDGTQTIFRKGDTNELIFEKEVRPDGNYITIEGNFRNRTLTSHDKKGKPLNTITRSDPLDGEWPETPGYTPMVTLRSDDGHAVEYRYRRHRFHTPDKEVYNKWVLESVTRTSGPSIHYQYENYGDCHHGYLAQINSPEGRYLRIERYLKIYINYVGDKKKVEVTDHESYRAENVRILYAPAGVDGAAIPIYQFYYHTSSKKKNREEGKATVWNARGQKRIYRHKRLRLTDIETYEHGQLYCKERFEWGKHNSVSDCDLQRRWVEDAEGVTCLEKKFTYDANHNVICEEVSGNITGLGTWDTAVKHFQYSQEGMNLLVRQEEEDKVTLINHIPGTNLIESKIEYEKGGLTRREFYRYNDAAVKIEEIFDDGIGDRRDDLRGVTQRLVRKIEVSERGMPIGVSEYYQEGESALHLLRREENSYTDQGRLIRQLQFDANNRYVTTLEWDYDSHGNITRFTDPEGYSTFRGYDANDNLIYEKKESDPFYKEWRYDLMNRMIAEIEVHPDRTFSSHFTYDIAGNKVSETDWYGNTTRYGSDFRDRIFETVSPIVKFGEGEREIIVRKKYDLLGRVSEIEDPNKKITRYENTIFGKPCLVTYPDKEQERFEYDLSGRLVAKIDPKGRRKEYTYDGFGRLLTETENGLRVKTRVYNAFHLLSESDAAGFTVYYEYNGAGKKIAEQAGPKRIEYEYDPQGRLIRTKCASQIAEVDYNLRDQPLEERLWDNEGNLLSRVGYVYDPAGRKTHTLTYTGSDVQVDEVRYNSRGDVIWHKNISGEVTSTYYDFDYVNERGQRVPREIRVDPMGQKMITIMDPVGKAVYVEMISPFGELLQKREYGYDLLGKRIASKESVVSGGRIHRVVLNTWEYDNMSRLVKVTEGAGTQEQKVTCYSYTATGKKQSVHKPDGKQLIFRYDDFDRVSELVGPDVHYAYSYDLQGNPIRVRDRVNKTTTLRTYSPERYLMSEKLGNGVQLLYDRDEEGKVTAVTIKGVGSIRYFYKGPRLHYIERWDEANKKLYSASYDAYDLTGKVTAMTLPHETAVKIEYDAAGRIHHIDSSLWEQSDVQYDRLGNVIHDVLKEPDQVYERDFSYDGLSQLTEERGYFTHTFKHDSLCNLIEEDSAQYEYNAINQPLNRDEEYDRNGNLIREGERRYLYDTLDRLIRVEEGGEEESYTYDELHRRLTAGSEKYIYLGSDEVGALKDGLLRSLRVLGKGMGAEIGASIAFELEGEVFAPIHDRCGHIAALCDWQGKLAQIVRYSAFGDYQTSGRVTSPWLFSSKRWDGKAKLFYFGRRYYNPRSHRWTTADPIKFDGGANLYAYVENNPLTLLDPYGLTAFGMNESRHVVYDYVFSFISRVTQYVGKAVEAVGAHLVPIPLVRDVIECAGYVMQGNDIKDYKMSYSRDHSCTGTFQGTNPTNSNKAFLLINGICTSYAEYMEQVAQFSADHGGADVEYVYNGTNGVICDLLECSMQKMGILTRPERMLHEKVKSIIDERGGVESDVQILMRAHSQGGLIAGNMVNYLTEDYTSKIHLRTMGSASVVSNRGFGSVKNYVASADYVPLTDPIGYLSAMFLNDRSMLISEPSKFHIMEHCLVDESYQDARKRINEEFMSF